MRSASCKSRTLGILGYGAFGRLMAAHLGRHFDVIVHDPRSPEAGGDPETGVRFAGQAEVAACDVVVLAAPVDQFRAAARAIRDHLRPEALLLDVGSVKVLPAAVLQEELPDHANIVCTHPLFGPQSASRGLKGLKLALCPLRGGKGPDVKAFLEEAFGLEVIVTTPEEHDRELALVQGLTHLIARVLVGMEPLPSRMTTLSFDLLMDAIGMVRDDPPGVFLAIERDNPYSREVRERFLRLADELSASFD